jgi:hypothetical protein
LRSPWAPTARSTWPGWRRTLRAGYSAPTAIPRSASVTRAHPAAPDGSLDKSFNGNGRVVLRIGTYYDDEDTYGEIAFKSIALQGDGKIVMRADGGWDLARINPDGTLDDSFRGTPAIAVLPVSAPPTGANFQGLWWNAGEPGWNISFSHQGDVVFATWATYDFLGKPTWLSMTATRFAAASYVGTLYQTTGPAYTSLPFDASRVKASVAGEAILVFSSGNEARLVYQALDYLGTKNIARYVYGSEVPTCTWGELDDLTRATNLQDLWYASPAGSEPGWGVSIADQGGVLAVTWLTYDLEGSPTWFFGAANTVFPGEYEGKLYQMSGPWLGTRSANSRPVSGRQVGRVGFSSNDGNHLYFTTEVDGFRQEKILTRYVFSGSGTACK